MGLTSTRLAFWLPPILWIGVILVLSTDGASGERTGRLLIPVLRAVLPGASPLQIEALHSVTRKIAHVTEYAVLAAMWFRAFARDSGWPAGRAGLAALAIAVAVAALDESHQTLVLSRTASLGDVGFDVLGALAATAVARWGWRPAAEAATGVLLWVAAIGGALIIALNLGVGVPSGLLWITVPAAVVALVVRRLRRPARR
jgi:VanZ family protein